MEWAVSAIERLTRNACHPQLVAMAMNMKRALVLMREA
jgi:hypothetical protein